MRLAHFIVPIVGGNVLRLRRDQRLTRKELAARIALLPRRCISPLSLAALTHLELGRRQSITSDEVAVLAAALNVAASVLTKATKVVVPLSPRQSPTADQRAARTAKSRRTPKLQLIRDKDVAQALGISPAAKGRWRRAGDFPQAIRLGDNTHRVRRERNPAVAGNAAGPAQGGRDGSDDVKTKRPRGALTRRGRFHSRRLSATA